MSIKPILTLIFSLTVLVGCQATGEQHRANVYKAGQVNMKQAAKTVEILAVMPARIEVDNSEAQQKAQVAGGILGAVLGAAIGDNVQSSRYQTNETVVAGALGGAVAGAATGSLVKDKVLVDGVSLVYVEDGETLSSAQVGKLCEFKPGVAVIISTGENETRVQPNATCPQGDA
ncbi:hypothetical protein ACSV5M_01635 [Cellvibrio sp. ARAG 10.3]|uniref:hypothetical protein n=1 Tax=Cellvibrio sp. ARAG 10.3 TaxID=3451358 RepID=UPI003F46D0EB